MRGYKMVFTKRNLLQLKTGVQYGKTVLSPETQVRNFYSAMMFPLARGVA